MKIENLSLHEKARLVAGENAWQTVSFDNVKSICMTDGPHGLRRQLNLDNAIPNQPSVPSTCFPTAAATSCSWDRALLFEIGKAIGEEAREQKVDIVLGPGVNIKRSPLCGRNFEYFSEDPLLAGEMASGMISGIQKTGTGACIKHFALNNREYFRAVSNSIADERAIREIYLFAFELAVKKSFPFSIMPSYNMINGEYSCENKWLLTDVLRNEWGFDGITISDWGAVNDRVKGIDAGLDLEMPGNCVGNCELVENAVLSGELSESSLDKCVQRILNCADKVSVKENIPFSCNMDSHHSLARRAAAESIVLLKNNSVLPIKNKRIAIIGAFAEAPRFQGTGSSKINPAKIETPLSAFRENGISFTYAPGYLPETGETSEYLISEAEKAVSNAELCILFAGLPESCECEGMDRPHMRIPDGMNSLISIISKKLPVAVILMGGSAVEMPWINDVSAVLYCALGGEAIGPAILDILTGKITPCGKLSETFPLSLNDTPCRNFFSNAKRNVEYRESIYVGYKFYEAAEKPVLFPFGFGLSYTEFEYSHFSANKEYAHVTITNKGSVPGAEIVQIYAKLDVLKLIGFEKVFVLPGESKTVRIDFCKHALEFFENGEWHAYINPEIRACSSSDNVRASVLISQNGSVPKKYPITEDWSSEEFYKLIGNIHHIPEKSEVFSLNSTFSDTLGTKKGDIIFKIVSKIYKKISLAGDSGDESLMHSLLEMPFRSVVSFSGGMLPKEAMLGLIDIYNKDNRRGAKRMIKAFLKRT